jgi:hypothetical protein
MRVVLLVGVSLMETGRCLFGRLKAAIGPDDFQIRDVSRASCKYLHEEDLLEGRSENAEPGMVENQTAVVLVEGLWKKLSCRIIKPGRG